MTAYKPKLLIIYVVLSLTLLLTMSMNVKASDYDIEDYKKVIKKVNEQNNGNFSITDVELFEKSICSKMALAEFEEMLAGNNTYFLYELPEDSNYSVLADNRQTKSSDIIQYFAPIKQGSWESRVNARIETNSNSEFVRYVDAGYAWDEEWTAWLFKASTIKCESFSKSSCKVSYKGVWRIPQSGITDPVYYTYNITYYPN